MFGISWWWRRRKEDRKMAIVDLFGLFIPPPMGGSNPGFDGMLLDAAGTKAAFIVQAPKTGSIRKIQFRIGAVGTATNTDVRIETIDTDTGDPTGTLISTDANVVVSAGSITSGVWLTATLTADTPVTKGQMIAVVMVPTGDPNYEVSTLTADIELVVNPNYCDRYAVSWAKDNSEAPVVALEYVDGSSAYMPGVWPITGLNAAGYESTSTPDEVGLKFSLPAPMRVIGMWMNADISVEADVLLYDVDGETPLATINLDDVVALSGGNHWNLLFPASVLLTQNVFYRLALRPTDAAAMSVTPIDVTVNSAAVLDTMSGGQNFHYTERTDAGAWTDVTTRRPFMGLIIDGIELPDEGGQLHSRMLGS